MRTTTHSALFLIVGAFDPALHTRHHALSAMRSDMALDSPASFVRVADYVTTCDSRIPAAPGMTAVNKDAALQLCTARPGCLAVTQGSPEVTADCDKYFLCSDESYKTQFAAAKDRDVFVRTVPLLQYLSRADALVYPDASMPHEICTVDHENDHVKAKPAKNVVNWPLEQRLVGLQMTAEVTGGGELLWSLQTCTSGVPFVDQPQAASDSLYVFLP